MPVQIQRHCCDEAPISVFVTPQNNDNEKIVVGYSSAKNGMTIAIRFQDGLFDTNQGHDMQVYDSPNIIRFK